MRPSEDDDVIGISEVGDGRRCSNKSVHHRRISTSLSKLLDKYSATRKKREGESGSPWRRPRIDWKKLAEVPFTRTEKQHEEMHRLIILT